MANTKTQAGAQSATFSVPPLEVGVTIGVLSATDWATLPSGKLKDLLNKSYGPMSTAGEQEASLTAFLDAAAAAGLSVIVMGRVSQVATLSADGIWFLQSSGEKTGFPCLTATSTELTFANWPFTARIQTAYSASE